MLLQSDCIPCIMRMALSSIRILGGDEKLIRETIVKILELPALRGLEWNITSPEVIEPVMEIFKEAFQTDDPFLALKEKQDAIALELYPKMKQLVGDSEDPLFAAVNLAILGNTIDLMISDRSIDVEQVLENEVNNPILNKPYGKFREKLAKTSRLLYLGDNAGEVVFDKVLIETIRDIYAPEINFVVRGVPALNDVTMKEAEKVGMDRVAGVISNGSKKSIPGTILKVCFSELRDLFETSDLIISKGGGNFDSLEGEKENYRKIAFMLLAKCHPFCSYFNIQMYQPILGNFFD